MVTVGMNYDVLPGKGEAFEAMFRNVIGVMDQSAGHGSSRLYQDVNDRQKYLIVSEWNDRSSFDAFIGSDQFRKVADWGKQQILAGRPSHEYYEH